LCEVHSGAVCAEQFREGGHWLVSFSWLGGSCVGRGMRIARFGLLHRFVGLGLLLHSLSLTR